MNVGGVSCFLCIYIIFQKHGSYCVRCPVTFPIEYYGETLMPVGVHLRYLVCVVLVFG